MFLTDKKARKAFCVGGLFYPIKYCRKPCGWIINEPKILGQIGPKTNQMKAQNGVESWTLIKGFSYGEKTIILSPKFSKFEFYVGNFQC